MKIVCMGDAHYASLPFKSKLLKEKNKYFYKSVFKELFEQEAELYISLGDLTNYGRKTHTKEIYSIINECKREDQRFVQVTGNHDLLAMSKKTYQEISGQKLYWVEDYPDCKLIFLDSCKQFHPGRSSSKIDWKQRKFLEEELYKSGDKLTLVFAHHPPERVVFYDQNDRVDASIKMEDILFKKHGRGVYINGHLHQDRYYTKGQWGFLQFNDILDEPTVRVLELSDGQLEMRTKSLNSPSMIEAASKISKSILTFYRKRNDELFARVRDLRIGNKEDEREEEEECLMDFLRLTSRPCFSKDAVSHLRNFIRFFKPNFGRRAY